MLGHYKTLDMYCGYAIMIIESLRQYSGSVKKCLNTKCVIYLRVSFSNVLTQDEFHTFCLIII